MGFFKELKEDFSQAVNELLPEEALFEDLPEQESGDGKAGKSIEKKNSSQAGGGRGNKEERREAGEPADEIFDNIENQEEAEAAASQLLEKAFQETAASGENIVLPEEAPLATEIPEKGSGLWTEEAPEPGELLQEEENLPLTEETEETEAAAGEDDFLPDAETQDQIAALRKEVFDDWLAKQAAVEEAPEEKSLSEIMLSVSGEDPGDRDIPESGHEIQTQTDRDVTATRMIKEENNVEKAEERNMAELDSVFNQASAAGDNDADLIAKLMEDGVKEGGIAEETASQIEDEKELGAVLENMEPEDDTTVITKGTTISGNIISNGSLEILGTVKGDLECLGKLSVVGNVTGNSVAAEIYVNTARLEGSLTSKGSVKIGAGTIVIGDIKGDSAVIAGAVKGEVDVNGPVIIDSTAIVKGNINAKSVQINNGAVVDGYCSLSYAAVDIDNFFDEEEK